jgi:hypothetical protein
MRGMRERDEQKQQCKLFHRELVNSLGLGKE